MPEMVPFCGGTFRVCRRAEKTCVEGLGMRSLGDAVFLEGLRCDGSAHGGCQRGCLFFWKTAWLKPGERSGRRVRSTEYGVHSVLRTSEWATASICQSTELAAATTDYPPGKLREYWHDLRAGEMTLGRLAFPSGDRTC